MRSTEMPQRKITIKKAFFVIAILFLVSLSLTASGFCWPAFKFVGQKEAVVRAFDLTSLHNGVSKLDPLVSCAPYQRPEGESNAALHIIDMIMGKLFHEIECVYAEGKPENHYQPYNWKIIVVNACASHVIDVSGGMITNAEYEEHIQKNRAFWQIHNR